MKTDLIKCAHLSEAVSILTLNRPDKRNAMNIQLMQELCDALEEIGKMKGKRVLIINGAGSVFCAGLDLTEAADLSLSHPSSELVARSLTTLYHTPLVTIAAVHGIAVGGGAGLMSACDFVVASKETQFGYPETRRGLVAALIMPMLLRQLKQRDIRELLLFGELIDAEKALSIGLINRVVENEALQQEAIKMADVVLKCAPEATKKTKELLDRIGFNTFPDELKLALITHQEVRESEEAKEGLTAFIEKRPPSWG